ncbi:adenylate cyclase associated N terminal-domain-containing protein [Cladochytrium replicatum]|nr:adenylate cyclase associated N terminal-domain-containing protein [Cladochytrium replicatum]
MADLTEIVRRLEAATTRLEQLSRAPGSFSATPVVTPSSSGGGSSSQAVTAFDDSVTPALTKFLALSEKVGGLVREQALAFKNAIANQKTYLAIASQSKKPDMTVNQSLVQPLQKDLETIISLREKNRASPLFNHLSTVSEGVPALGWIMVEPTPVPYVGEMKDAAQFYSNRVIKEYKDKDKTHVDWANSFLEVLTELQAYVKKFHTTGVAWNPKGGDAKTASADVGHGGWLGRTSDGAPSGGPPPPPLPTAEQLEKFSSPAPKPAAAGGLFSEINKGNVTAGLRKVDKSEMTHKNPELRAGSVVKADDVKPAASSAPKYGAAAVQKPARTALEGNKWTIENHVNNSSIVIEDVQLKHVVYIYNCQNSTIQIKGKVNAITLDNCKKSGLVVESVVSTVDAINCKSVQVQITGKAPTVNIDKTDGLQLFLSQQCLDIDIMTAKSSEMNVLFQETAGGDFVEKPVVEQFRTKIVNGNLVTNPVEHTG